MLRCVLPLASLAIFFHVGWAEEVLPLGAGQRDEAHYGAADSSLGVPSPWATPPVPELRFQTSATLFQRARGAVWYARADYLQWRESADSRRILQESGPLVTVGFLRQRDASRWRAELFGGSVYYDGQTLDGEPLQSHTGYLGFRAEYDFLWALLRDPDAAMVLRLGTRFWNRALGNGSTESGIPVYGYDETWWTVYPGVGLETRRPLGTSSQWFATACLGVTAWTYEAVPAFDVALYPKPGPLLQLDLGIQTPRLLVWGFVELAQWYTSNASGYVYQPDSTMFTAGLGGGLRF